MIKAQVRLELCLSFLGLLTNAAYVLTGSKLCGLDAWVGWAPCRFAYSLPLLRLICSIAIIVVPGLAYSVVHCACSSSLAATHGAPIDVDH